MCDWYYLLRLVHRNIFESSSFNILEVLLGRQKTQRERSEMQRTHIADEGSDE